MRLSALVLPLLVAGVLSAGISCGGGGTAPAETPASFYTLYSDEANGFSIQYPHSWQLDAGEALPEGLMVVCSAESTCGGFTAKVAVQCEELPSAMTAAMYLEAQRLGLGLVGGYTAISDETVMADGETAVKHVYTLAGGNSTRKAMGLYLVDGMTGWVVTGVSALDCWSQYEPVFDAVLHSFRLVD